MDLDKEILELLKYNSDEVQLSETLNIVIKSIPGAMEKLKSIDSEIGKLNYYLELMEIVDELEEFQEGKGIPN